MKLRHTITRDGCTLSGKILETIFEGNEKRGDCSIIRIGAELCITSTGYPELYKNKLYVFGLNNDYDSRLVSYTYDSEQEARAMLDAINSITIKEPTGFCRIQYIK